MGDEVQMELPDKVEPALPTRPACTRCGRCCLSSPCWEVPSGTGVMVELDGAPLHVCPHLSLHKGVATCAVYYRKPPEARTGQCGNGVRDEFPWSLERVEQFLTERRRCG
jgi:hypothetical protein